MQVVITLKGRQVFMNSKKFSVYKNAIYFYIASLILLVAGLIVGIIFGLNSAFTLSSKTVLNTVLAVLVFEIILLCYSWIKYDFYTAFTFVLAVLHNVLLTTALTAIFRIPVIDNFVITLLLVCALTMLNQFILFADKVEYKVTTNREQMVNDLVDSKLKIITLINCTLIACVVLMIFTFSTSVVMLVRPLLIALIVIFYSTVFMCAPFYGYFIKEKKQRKVVDLEQDYVK